MFGNQTPQALEKTVGALNTGVIPLQRLFRRRGLHDEQADGVGAVLLNQFLWVDGVAFRLGHL